MGGKHVETKTSTYHTSVIPIGESISTRRTPVVTIGLILACALVFLYELTLRQQALDLFIEQWGAVPQRVLPAISLDPRAPRFELLN